MRRRVCAASAGGRGCQSEFSLSPPTGLVLQSSLVWACEHLLDFPYKTRVKKKFSRTRTGFCSRRAQRGFQGL
jgi:hypothetical protein